MFSNYFRLQGLEGVIGRRLVDSRAERHSVSTVYSGRTATIADHAFRPSPHAGQAGGHLSVRGNAGLALSLIEPICPTVFGRNYLMRMS